MSSRELREYVRAVPFIPFRLVMTDGKEYEVTGPEWLMVGTNTSILGVPNEEDVAGEMIRISHWHVQRVISPATAQLQP